MRTCGRGLDATAGVETADGRIWSLPEELGIAGVGTSCRGKSRGAGCDQLSCRSVLISGIGLNLRGLCPHDVHGRGRREVFAVGVARRSRLPRSYFADPAVPLLYPAERERQVRRGRVGVDVEDLGIAVGEPCSAVQLPSTLTGAM